MPRLLAHSGRDCALVRGDRGREARAARGPGGSPRGRGKWGAMTRIALLPILLLLAACNSMSLPGWPKAAPEAAASASAWTKPGADAATVEGAYSDCLAAT